MHHKNEFIEYCERRGYEIIPGTLSESPAGVSAVIDAGDITPHEHFTSVIVHDRQDKNRYSVRLSYRDFENEAITGGFMETDCDHSDTRVCQALGHATGRSNEPS